MRIDALLSPRPHRRRAALAGGLLAALAASAVAAVALAQPPTPAGGGKPLAKWGPIDIAADRVETDKAHHTSLWIGDATVSGITKQTLDGVFIDGRPATEADLPKLPQTRFASIKATFNPNGHELDRLDAQTKPGGH
jgi:hypothetical protein